MSTGTVVAAAAGDEAPKPRKKKGPNIGNTLMLRVDQLVSDRWENPRLFMTDDHIVKLMKSLEQNGQIADINVTEILDDNGLSTGKFAIVCGWTRSEAFRRLVFNPLIRKYNKEKKGTSDAGAAATPATPAAGEPEVVTFLTSENKADCDTVAKAYPEEYEAAVNKLKVRAFVVSEEEVPEIMARSMAENEDRKGLSVYEKLATLDKLIDRDGMTAANAAKRLSLNAPYVSQIRKVQRVVKNLIVQLTTPDPWEADAWTEEKKSIYHDHAVRLVGELNRRLCMTEENTLCLSLSHLREFAARADGDTKELPRLSRKHVFQALARLTGASSADKSATPEKEYAWLSVEKGLSSSSPENYTIFMDFLKTAESMTTALRAGKSMSETDVKAAAAAAAPAAGTPAGTPASSVETKDTLAAQQVAANTAAAVSTGNTVPTEGSSAEGATASEMANVNEANAASATAPAATAPASIGGLNLVDDNMDVDVTAMTKGKSAAAPESTIKLKPTDLIVGFEKSLTRMFNGYSKAELAEQNTALGLLALSALFTAKDILGKSKEYNTLYQMATDLAQSYGEYVGNLENFKAEVLKKNPKITYPFLTKPELPTLPGSDQPDAMNAEDILGDDDMGEGEDAFDDYEDEGDMPSSEDLESLEAEIGEE